MSKLPLFIEPCESESGFTSIRKEKEMECVIHEETYQLSFTAFQGGWIAYYMNLNNGEWAQICDGEEFVAGKDMEEAAKKLHKCLVDGDIV